MPTHLSQTRDAGLDPVAGKVGFDLFGVLLIMADGMGAWTYQGHGAVQNIKQLGQLINTGFTNKPPCLRES